MSYLAYDKQKYRANEMHYIRVLYKDEWWYYIRYSSLESKLELTRNKDKAIPFRYGAAYGRARNLRRMEVSLELV